MGPHCASVFQGFLEPSFAEAAAFCLPVGIGLAGIKIAIVVILLFVIIAQSCYGGKISAES